MKLLVDENVSRRIAERLQKDRHTVLLGQQVVPGRPDYEVLALAQSLSAVILTEDNDFSDLVIRQNLSTAGVILLRLSGMDRSAQPDFIAQALATHEASVSGHFTVITPSGVRIRTLP